jgi:hypothetical protein
MARTHVNCTNCHAEVAVDLEKCPSCGEALPQGEEHELSGVQARLAALRKDVADRKQAALDEIAKLEKQVGQTLAEGLAKVAS